jgi:hypothetical protein
MTVYRNQSYALLITVVAVLFFLASIVAAFARDGDFTTRWVPVLPVLALSCFCLLRLARAGVYAEDEGVRILNPLSSTRIPWEHLQRFTLGPHKGFAALGFAERVDGTKVEIWGIQSRSHTAAAKKIPEQVIEELNERLREERARLSATA